MTLYLIARLGETKLVLDANRIGSVIEVERIAPVPSLPPHVAGLCALRSRVLTVIDGGMALGLGAVDRAAPIAAVCEVDGHHYAFLFDEVEDVVEAGAFEPCPVALAPTWAHAALGLVRVAGVSMLLVDPAAIIAGPMRAAA